MRMMFRRHMRVLANPNHAPRDFRTRPKRPSGLVTRIEFRKVPGSERVPVQQGLAL